MSERITEAWLSAEDLATAVGITVTRLERLVILGVVEPSVPDRSRFAAESAARLRRVIRLHGDLGVRFADAAIILDLLDRVESLEAELARLRSGI
jgi:MerR family transcriptional regulator/heat shock protein HspR